MHSFEEIFSSEEVIAEYRKSFLLNMFKKLVVRMNRDKQYLQHVRNLFLQSTNKALTISLIIKQNFEIELSMEEARFILDWLEAYFKKSSRRRSFTAEFRKDLYDKQNGLCRACGEPLGSDMSKVHVDHIIPWMLVGDELKDNYQCLCETCNECKSAHTDYMFKNLIKLN